MNFEETAARYRKLLVEDVLPWWAKHAIDHEHGGLFSCIGDDGTVTSEDKYIWSQVRGLWTFSASCRRVHSTPEWRKIADGLFRFSMRFGRNDAGDWNFLVNREGALLRGPESIQTDAYAICALVEYALLTQSDEACEAAFASFRRTREKIWKPGSFGIAPYPLPEGARAHRASMQLALAYHDLARATGDAEVLAEAMKLTDDCMDNFRRPDLEAVVEYLALDNTLLPPSIGTFMSPGHGIETAWFNMDGLRGRNEEARIGKALDAMRWSMEKGWDHEYGGIFLGIDLNGGTPFFPKSDAKIWWPFCEAICGLLLAYELSSDSAFLDWHAKVEEWAFAHFPVPEHGEWRQRLDRRGERLNDVVALPVKDPFHLPRAALYAFEIATRLAERGAAGRELGN
ncbi:MAG: AGE family epimerase/isomerase [Bryobacteraceae bacterium]